MNSGNPSPALTFRPFRRPSQPISGQETPWQYQILDPGGKIVTRWNHVFLVSCLIALFLDPIYFYLPHVGGPACLSMDLNLGITVTFFRSVADLFYLVHMIMKFRTAFVSPSSRVFGRGELVMDGREIALRYLKSDFVIDLAATLPLPQMVIWFILPAVRQSATDHTNNTLALIVLLQYVPRLFLIFPLNRRIIKNTGVVANTAWAGAAYNLLLYMLASHVLGASWYVLSIERQHTCWRSECQKEETAMLVPCNPIFLDCRSLEEDDRNTWLNITRVISNCDISNDNIQFKFGLFSDALSNDVVTARFLERYLYCLWWGLKNLSSYGQNLDTSTYIGETSFCILICIVGLVLFSHLIGNMQTYLASMTVRLEEWRVKRRDTEEWMRHRQLPLDLQERVRRFVQYKWLATRGVDEESILLSLPLDLRREIQRHLCLALVRRVPFFSQMDDQLLDAICERLVSSLSTQDTYIVREGDPVNEMLFIIRGQLESSTTNGGRSGFFNSITLRPGDFCGEELLTWALMPNSSLNLPSSTRTVRALGEVEAFALCAEDLKFVAGQFKRLHSKKLQHAFRYYSHQWRTWGACFIQAAWRRFKKRKLAKELMMHERYSNMPIPNQESDYGDEALDVYYEDDDTERLSTENENNTQHLGATILASRFAANTRRGVNQKFKVVDTSASSLKMPKLFKPEEPDFSND
ncbi:cyclic nucleotide-gated ion channel 18-like [Macadamia integrifolia]|uniref:cyclic nucleotide-gated ion channel 18-like n=1 Tax=Macadamia integrifolia TaxID=60698 RepID=UPI001C5015FD|nr:cyclic nucleotide-gated ion channel 18-like [Macadamia integrifolia]XP_042499757.1 cyclic nucleotide-gated ion channel 18-like [Macadamia integrifolia]